MTKTKPGGKFTCKDCGYIIEHFTDTTDLKPPKKCPRCKGKEFNKEV